MKSDAESKEERESPAGKKTKKNNWEDAAGMRGNIKPVNDSKEEKSDGMGRALPARHCFTSRCTEEENLSYASAFHIAFTIYVPAGIMQLDGSVEKTPINLVLFSISSCLSP